MMSEDCLSININRPTGVNESSALPVMVWVYGGGFQGLLFTSFPRTLILTHCGRRMVFDIQQSILGGT